MIKPVVRAENDDTIEMKDMKPLQIAVIVGSQYDGQMVMRTASAERREFMDLTKPGANKCWEGACALRVRLLKPGTKIVLEVTE